MGRNRPASAESCVRGSRGAKATRMKNRSVSRSPNCELVTMLQPFWVRNPEMACTMPIVS
jgi:hypothetical protein